MRKQIVTMLCGAVVLALAVPAFSATTTLTGRLRSQGVIQNVQTAVDATNRKFVAQRLNTTLTVNVNDIVSVVYAGEIDSDWGINQSSTSGNDGAYGGDGVNLETKNLYAAFKVPGDNAITVKVGLQGIADGIQNIYFRDDAAALTASAKFGMIDLMLGWAKLTESGGAAWNSPADNYTAISDDVDVYYLQAGVMPMEGTKVGLETYWLHDQGVAKDTGRDLYTIALTGASKIAMVNIDGFVAFQSGKYNVNSDTNEMKVNTFAASIDAGAKFTDALSADLRVIYFGNDDDEDDVGSWQDCYSSGGGRLNFIGSNMAIFMANAYKTGFGDSFADNVVQGYLKYGLLAAVLNVGYDFNPFYVKGAVGYFQTLKDKVDGEANASIGGTHLGYEMDLIAGMKITSNANLYFHGAYAILGDAFDDAVTVGSEKEDADNMYFAGLGVDVNF